jgi:hypothetical protein
MEIRAARSRLARSLRSLADRDRSVERTAREHDHPENMDSPRRAAP